jgi:1,2-dihydroxy-3-keto-5-methylthiopentene dioxygenase
MRAYYFDNLPGDQRLPHDCVPSRPVAPETLAKLNVKVWTIPVAGHEAAVDALARERGYKNRDTIEVSKEGLGEVRCAYSYPGGGLIAVLGWMADLRGEDQDVL